MSSIGRRSTSMKGTSAGGFAPARSGDGGSLTGVFAFCQRRANDRPFHRSRKGMAGRSIQGLIDVLEGCYGGNPAKMPYVVNKEAFAKV